MAKKAVIERCRVLRTYSGEEGRPRKGDVFVVEGKPVEGLTQITLLRFNSLFKRGLVEPTTADAATGGKTDEERKDKRAPEHPKKVERDSKKKRPAAATVRPQPGRKTGLPGNGPDGGLIGGEGPLSSSEAEQAQGAKAQTKDVPAASTGQQPLKRGERREPSSSPSTTPTGSTKDSTPSTAATSDGGKSTRPDAGESDLE